MSFNPDPSKQAVGVIFSRKIMPNFLSQLMFNNASISCLDAHKNLGVIFDKGLIFQNHLKEEICKANKGIGLIRRICIYAIHFCVSIKHSSDLISSIMGISFMINLAMIPLLEKLSKFNIMPLAITGCFQGTFQEKLYLELGLESLSNSRRCRWYKIIKNLSPIYLKNLHIIKLYTIQDANKFYKIFRHELTNLKVPPFHTVVRNGTS